MSPFTIVYTTAEGSTVVDVDTISAAHVEMLKLVHLKARTVMILDAAAQCVASYTEGKAARAHGW